VTISGPERPKVRIFRSEGRNVVNFVEKVTISRVGQAFPGEASGDPKVRSRLSPQGSLPRRGGDFKIDPFSGRFGQISRKK